MICYKPLQVSHDYMGQGYRMVVIYVSWIWFCWHRYYGAAFETDGHSGLAEGDVKYVREDILQLHIPSAHNLGCDLDQQPSKG